MGKAWDALPPGDEVFAELLRVCKPGAHLLSFGGTRTWHRLAVAVEDGGWEIRDTMMWVYGSGFPKNHNVSKAIDKAAGAERKVVGRRTDGRYAHGFSDAAKRAQGTVTHEYSAGWTGDPTQITAPATPDAQRWGGWGTALKPAFEPIVLARKPLAGTVASNVVEHGTGALNIDACRVPFAGGADESESKKKNAHGDFGSGENVGYHGMDSRAAGGNYNPPGRFPANLLHDGSPDVVGLFPQTGKSTGGRTVRRSGGGNVGSGKASEAAWSSDDPGYGDAGSAARFFYCAKASKAERAGVAHPTVKPLALIRYLLRLTVPPGGLVLDPFLGSGTAMLAAEAEGFTCWGAEMTPAHWPMVDARWDHRDAIIAQSDKNLLNHPALQES